MQFGSVGLVADAGGDRQTLARHDGDAVGLEACSENGAGFEACRIDPGQARRSAVGHQNLSVVGDDSGRFRKALQGRDMLARVVIDDLDAAAAGVRHEDTAGFGVEGAMIEGASCRAGIAILPIILSGMVTSRPGAATGTRCRARRT